MSVEEIWRQRLKQHKRRSRPIEIGCVASLIMVIFWITIVACLVVSVVGVVTVWALPLLASQPEEPGEAAMSTIEVIELTGSIAISLMVCIGGLLWLRRMRSQYDSRGAVRLQDLPEAERGANAAIVDEVSELAGRLGIPSPTLWLSGSISKLRPVCAVVNGEVSIVIPKGFVLWRRAKPVAAKGTIAHELAHVVQEDPLLWRRGLIAGRAGLLIVILTFALLAFEFAVGAAKGSFEPSPTGCGWIIAFVFSLRMSIYRRRSEYLADLGAAVAAGEEAATAALESIRDEGWFERLLKPATHPSSKARMRRLRASIAAASKAR